MRVPEPGAASCMQLGGVRWEHLQVAKSFFCMVCWCLAEPPGHV